jgi:hypothetical protein
MQITKERFVDAGFTDEDNRDKDRLYDHYYAGCMYRFEVDDQAMIARQYEDEPKVVCFLRLEVRQGLEWILQSFVNIPYKCESFRAAICYLIESEGVEEVTVSWKGFETVDLRRIV